MTTDCVFYVALMIVGIGYYLIYVFSIGCTEMIFVVDYLLLKVQV